VTADGDRPIPVRSVAPAARPEPSDIQNASPDSSSAPSGPVAPAAPSPPPRLLDAREGRWEVRPIGRTRTGHGRDAGALLLLVRFEPLEGGEGEAGTPRSRESREGLVVARSLDDLDDEALEALLERARPAP